MAHSPKQQVREIADRLGEKQPGDRLDRGWSYFGSLIVIDLLGGTTAVKRRYQAGESIVQMVDCIGRDEWAAIMTYLQKYYKPSNPRLDQKRVYTKSLQNIHYRVAHRPRCNRCRNCGCQRWRRIRYQ